MNLLTADQLGEVLERTRQDLFRIETLPSYDTAMTTGDFRRWLGERASRRGRCAVAGHPGAVGA